MEVTEFLDKFQFTSKTEDDHDASPQTDES